jgi:hypothetical protein
MLQTTIASVWGLELLLLLRGQPARRWTAQDLVTELRSSRLIVDGSVDRLERGGLVSRDEAGAVAFSPANAELEALVEAIEQEYRLRPDYVRRAIVSGADNKLNSFANAFILRKPRS